ncbi:MAG: 3-phosphoshikimate 1-carboxyvinyltransferase [Clostridia bacterium]|nr:3-phosphoshikimate 1-carboxyvinyltransferase [Clostridia bacterium]
MNKKPYENGILFAKDGRSVTVMPGSRSGMAYVPSSKSVAHRMLICAALSGSRTEITIREKSKDIDATVSCLKALGAGINGSTEGNVTRFVIDPVRPCGQCGSEPVRLNAGESGSTLRFLVPVVCALGKKAVFTMEGRLPERPMDALLCALSGGGAEFSKSGNELFVSGRLRPGHYSLPGNISSQFISGMLFALPLLEGMSTLTIEGRAESSDYIKLTEDALEKSGIKFGFEGGKYTVPGCQQYSLSGVHFIEGDWSGAAFLLCAGGVSVRGVTVCGLRADSAQGDKKIIDVLRAFGALVELTGDCVTVRKNTLRGIDVDASEIPDLVPAIASLAAVSEGTTRITGAARLRLKESDRIRSTASMLNSIGADALEQPDGLVIEGKRALSGGNVDPFGDHRIAMAAGIAAGAAQKPVVISDPCCVSKSFPGFWDVLKNDITPERETDCECIKEAGENE